MKEDVARNYMVYALFDSLAVVLDPEIRSRTRSSIRSDEGGAARWVGGIVTQNFAKIFCVQKRSVIQRLWRQSCKTPGVADVVYVTLCLLFIWPYQASTKSRIISDMDIFDTRPVSPAECPPTASGRPSSPDDGIITNGFEHAFETYQRAVSTTPLLLNGDALAVLRELPSDSVDFAMTSPPYWGKREYDNGGIGLEADYREFVRDLVAIFAEIKRVLKSTGSFWLNLGDTYNDKGLVGIPWRVAFELTDNQGWLLRNSVVWNKLKGGMDNSKDRLGNLHENVFHFVKQARGYYYNADAIRSRPREAKVVNGAVISATGVSGVRYRRQIELSTALDDDEKKAAFNALEKMLASVAVGDISDFRMVIRGQQRTTHSDSAKVSGRAKELRDKGFYFLKYHPKGSKPGDVWDIIPEDSQRREGHFAPYPIDLCRIPLLATCPEGGIALDPFCGTGTTLVAARNLGRKSIGIDISRRYLELTQERCYSLL